MSRPCARPVLAADGQPLDEDLLAYLEEPGEIVRVGDVAFAPEAYEAMVERVTQQLREEGTVTLGEVRDMFGTSGSTRRRCWSTWTRSRSRGV